MGKRDEIKAQIDKLTKEYNAADDDDDLEIDIERDGIKARVRGKHARRALKRLGLDDDDEDQGDAGDKPEGEPAGDDKGEGDPAGDDKGDPAPKPGNRYFR